jgi:carbon starvation protein CstA
MFFRLKKHVSSTLVSEMGCALGFGQGYVKTSPMASTRVKAAIMPAISILAVAVLTNEETAILWPVFGLNKFLINTVILLIIAALICKKLRDKTFYSAK